MKKNIPLFLFISISFPLFIISCDNSTEPDNILTFLIDTPVVTGLVITSADSPEPIGIWRNPQTQTSIYYGNNNSNSSGILPGNMSLSTPYPNPTNGSISIRFFLPISTNVSVWLVKARLPEEKEKNSESLSGGAFASTGNRNILKLMNNELKNAGSYYLEWNGKKGNGQDADVGFYRIYLKADKYLFWQDILLARKISDLPTDLRYLWNH